MSKARRLRRAQERAASKHFEVLGELLCGFYEFLEKKNKPTDEEVRREFTKRDKYWKHYCSANQLNERASLLFNHEVAQSWKTRYAKKPLPTQN